MPPALTRTYGKKERKDIANISKSVDAFNALFAQNLTKRLIGKSRKKKAKIVIKDLPPRTGAYLTDDSIQISTEDTFDKLLKGKVYNDVEVKDHFDKITSSESEVSTRSKIVQISQFHSPIMTRRRKRQAKPVIAEISSPTDASLKHADHLTLFTKPVEESLFVEKVPKSVDNNKDFSSLSYIKLPKISENVSTGLNSSRMEASYEPIFSDTFKERQAVHSSTPYVVATKPEIIADAISPISRQELSQRSKLIDQSYDEIKKWDSNFPFDTPKRAPRRSGRNLNTATVQPVIKKTRRKSILSDPKTITDWKLRSEPKITLRRCETPEFRGFDENKPTSNLESFQLQWKEWVNEAESSPKLPKNSKNVEIDSSGAKNVKVASRRGRHRSGKTEAKCHGYFTRNRGDGLNKPNSTNDNIKKIVDASEVGQTKSQLRCCWVNIEKYPSIPVIKVEKPSAGHKNRKSTQRRKSTGQCEIITINDSTVSLSPEKVIRGSVKSKKDLLGVPSRRMTRSRSCLPERSKESSSLMVVSNLESTRESPTNTSNQCNEAPVVGCLTRRMKRALSCSQVATLQTSEASSATTSTHENPTNLFNQGSKAPVVGCLTRSSKRALSCLSAETLQTSEASNGTTSIHENSTNFSNRCSKAPDVGCVTRRMKRALSCSQVETSQMSETSSATTNKSHVSRIAELEKSSELADQSRSESSRISNSSRIETDLPSSTPNTSSLYAHFSTSPKKSSIWNTDDASGSSASLFDISSDAIVVSPIKHASSEFLNLSDSSVESDQIESLVADQDDVEQVGGSLTMSLDNFNKFYESCYVEEKVVEGSAAGIDIYSSRERRMGESQSALQTENDNDTDSSSEREMQESILVVSHDHPYASPDRQCRKKLSRRSRVKEVQQLRSSNNKDKSGDRSSDFSDVVESSQLHDLPGTNQKVKRTRCEQNFVTLRPGKLYRRSLSYLKRCTNVIGGNKKDACSNECICAKCIFRRSIKNVGIRGRPSGQSSKSPFKIVSLSNRRVSLLEAYALNTSYVPEEEHTEANLEDSIRGLSLNSRKSLVTQEQNLPVVTARDIVLRRCGQTEPRPFRECYPDSLLQNCRKIGEGVYGEVYLFRNQKGGTSVMKIIPIEGDQTVNGERQKKYDEILSEIIIAMELSNLRNPKIDSTTGFSEVQNVKCVQGRYPERLCDLWDLYDETRGSENDSPQMFTDQQLYIVLELANGGQDMEAFVFNNAMQAFALFKQTACALAVAESQLKFEHRDLHWGNILITSVDSDKKLKFFLSGKEIEVAAEGVEVSIIDFTLSRIEFDGVVIFNDLGLDNELFSATGDYQFDIYRLMQKSNGNEWRHYEPYSNVLWLHYVLDKATNALRYKNIRSKVHKEYLDKLNKLKEEILTFSSVVDFVHSRFL